MDGFGIIKPSQLSILRNSSKSWRQQKTNVDTGPFISRRLNSSTEALASLMWRDCPKLGPFKASRTQPETKNGRRGSNGELIASESQNEAPYTSSTFYVSTVMAPQILIGHLWLYARPAIDSDLYGS